MSSIKVPFSIAPSGKVATVNAVDKIVEQQIINVLTTSVFERVMRPNYGAGVRNLLFEPVDDLLYGEFKVDALQKVNRSISTGVVTDLIIKASDAPYVSEEESTTLKVTARYSLRVGSTQTVSFQIALPSQLTEESLI